MTPDLLDLFESRLESLGDLLESLTVSDWALCCQTLLPERYGDTGPSRKTTQTMPGSRGRIEALRRRARARQALHRSGDLQVPGPVSCGPEGIF